MSQALSFRQRSARAMRVARAIRDASPEDMLQLLPAVLIDLSAGAPEFAPFPDAEDAAHWWASLASPVELNAAIGAALRVIGTRAMHTATRKALFVTLWNSFGENDRRAFLIRVDRAARLGRRSG